MHFLLDTHILLWSLYSSEKLPEIIRTILNDDSSHVEYSIASLWEIEIKNNKYQKSFMFSSDDTYRDAQSAGFHMMGIKPPHIGTLGSLKEPERKHSDPFDRMLIAQAKYENVYLLTHDKRLADYGEECVQYF